MFQGQPYVWYHMEDVSNVPSETPSCAALGGWSENFNSVDPWDFSRGPPWWVAFWVFPHEKRERFEWEIPWFFPCSSYSSSQKIGVGNGHPSNQISIIVNRDLEWYHQSKLQCNQWGMRANKYASWVSLFYLPGVTLGKTRQGSMAWLRLNECPPKKIMIMSDLP